MEQAGTQAVRLGHSWRLSLRSATRISHRYVHNRGVWKIGPTKYYAGGQVTASRNDHRLRLIR